MSREMPTYKSFEPSKCSEEFETDGLGNWERLPQVEKQTPSLAAQKENRKGLMKECHRSDFLVEMLGKMQRGRCYGYSHEVGAKTFVGLDDVHIKSFGNQEVPDNEIVRESDAAQGDINEMLQKLQECVEVFNTSDDPVFLVHGLECAERKRCASTVEIEDLLTSLQSLICVLKNHEDSEQEYRAKLQILVEEKQALKLEKFQYKRRHDASSGGQAFLPEDCSPKSQDPHLINANLKLDADVLPQM